MIDRRAAAGTIACLAGGVMESGDFADVPAGRVPRRAPTVRGIGARVADTIGGMRARLAHRRRMRTMGRIVWRGPLALMILLVVLAMIGLDTVVAGNRLPQGSLLLGYARAWTDVAKTYTILVPTLLVLIAALLVDWRSLRPRARLLGLHWSALSAYLLLSVAATEIVLTVLKYATGRARPSLFLEVGAFHFDPLMFHFRYASFPSGHSGTAGSATMALALLFPQLRLPLLVLALWLATTRIFVVAHYPSDAIAGLMIGAWLAYVMALVFARHGLLFNAVDGRLPRRRRLYLVPRWLRDRWRGLRRRPGAAVSGRLGSGAAVQGGGAD